MTSLGTYNRLDRSTLDIARLALEDNNRIINTGFILVRKTSDGSQGTYDVRHYNTIDNVPDYFKGHIFNVRKELINDQSS